MQTEDLLSCPICGDTAFKDYLSAKDHTVTLETFQIKQCNNCGFLITTPRPTESEISKYYQSEKYISHSGTRHSLFDKIYHLARRISLNWKFKLIEGLVNKKSSLLDYGCGTGEFLKYMQSKDYNVIGIEPSDAAREKANKILDGKVFKTLNHLDDNSLDVITLWHVLEHVHQLNDTLQNLKKLLTPNGLIIIAVPNPQSKDSKKYKNYWAGYDVPRHLWHFTQETLQELLFKNGMKIVQTQPMKLDSYYVCLLSEGYKKAGQAKPITATKAFYQGFMSNLSAKSTGEYSSLIYIVKKV